jgi:uncharacterized protein YjbI with pentapeptide repeats
VSRRGQPRPGPRPAEARLPAYLAPHDGSALEPEQGYDGVAFADQDFDDQDGAGVRFIGCSFSGCSMARTDLTRSSLREVRIQRLRAVGTELAGSGWLDVLVADSLMAVPQLYDARLERVVFTDCRLEEANFRDATLTDVRFERCILTGADFGRATLRGVRFPGSRLAGADLTQATLEAVDLRGCELGIERGLGALGGAIIDRVQLVALAPALAAHLGVDVRDPDEAEQPDDAAP